SCCDPSRPVFLQRTSTASISPKILVTSTPSRMTRRSSIPAAFQLCCAQAVILFRREHLPATSPHLSPPVGAGQPHENASPTIARSGRYRPVTSCPRPRYKPHRAARCLHRGQQATGTGRRQPF
ncbi:hypothetical protein C8T65DRAFT_642202, partial [Cerioporus squamosus]